jgi:putative aldouronate transport system permease protein
MNLETSVERIVIKTKRKSIKNHLSEFWEQKDLQMMVFPWIIFLLIFSYVPMYGLIMAFQEYQLGDIPGLSTFVGLQHFQMLFQSPEFLPIMRNTFVISFLKLLLAFPAPIIFAILLNEVSGVKFKRAVQTVSYLPHFVSWVVVAGLAFDFLSSDGGAFNAILQSIGLIDTPITFMAEAKYFWGIVVISDLWKEIGWNAIIYIAAIASIDPELYQAADIDGAGRLRKIWHITLAGIKPTIIILLIITISNLLNAGFEQILLLTNNLTNATIQDVSEIIDTYVYRTGIAQMRYSYATAAGLFKSVVSIALLTIANYVARLLGEESLW